MNGTHQTILRYIKRRYQTVSNAWTVALKNTVCPQKAWEITTEKETQSVIIVGVEFQETKNAHKIVLRVGPVVIMTAAKTMRSKNGQ